MTGRNFSDTNGGGGNAETDYCEAGTLTVRHAEIRSVCSKTNNSLIRLLTGLAGAGIPRDPGRRVIRPPTTGRRHIVNGSLKIIVRSSQTAENPRIYNSRQEK